MSKNKEVKFEAEDDVSLLSILLDEKNDENIFLFDESGDQIELEQIAVIPYEKALYALLRPLEEDEDSAVVFKISTEDEDSMIQVEDEELAMKILEIYNSME
ncbi:MAG: DUF1292 domain-containing protein [Firmicutes bacterium]|nr:DUF1292 domain-containing protein [Bacillota bacterium]